MGAWIVLPGGDTVSLHGSIGRRVAEYSQPPRLSAELHDQVFGGFIHGTVSFIFLDDVDVRVLDLFLEGVRAIEAAELPQLVTGREMAAAEFHRLYRAVDTAREDFLKEQGSKVR